MAEITKGCMERAAKAVWGKARLASELRHLAKEEGRTYAASILGKAKTKCILQVILIAPDKVHIGMDSDLQIGMPAVRLEGCGSLHVLRRNLPELAV